MGFYRKRRHRRRSPARRTLDLLLALAVIGAVAVVVAQVERFAGEEIAGPFRVVDGDTLASGKRRLRLKGIDAPELDQTCGGEGGEYACGQIAAGYLQSLAGQEVRCRTEGVDRYRRELVRCWSGSVDLNRAMVVAGHAVAYGDYEIAEAEARLNRVGLWAGTFTRPADWRAAQGGQQDWRFADLVVEQASAAWVALRAYWKGSQPSN